MKASQKCVDLIKQFEGYKDKAYLCPAGVATIGYGSTMWNDGRRVQMGDKITKEGAELLLHWELNNKAVALYGLNVNQNQADAILSFVFNLGIGAFQKSTLIKKIRLNPNDPTIRDEFMRWNKTRVGGKLTPMKGLTRRRTAESNLYYDTN
jgi:lysozyme